MNFADLDLSKTYSYADYLQWKFEEQIELIKGKIFRMSPAPVVSHQKVASRLHLAFAKYLENKKCEVFFAPFDVRLIKNTASKDEEIFSVVQPDICIVCDPNKLDRRGCLGAPDLIVEITSQSTAKKDYDEKYHLYEQNGVKEYWIANPKGEEISVYFLDDNNQYKLVNHYELGDQIPVNIFPELIVDTNKIFDFNK